MGIIHVRDRFIFFYVLLITFPVTISNPDSEALLKLKESFANATVLDSWQPGTEPCAGAKHWVGVLCENGVVSGLRLGHLGLSGKIDVDALVPLSGLRSVAFMSNSFSGQIPDFNRLGALRGLYISDNQFSGGIPSDYFSAMEGLKKLWLARNRFSGPIPSSVSHLSQLMELHLENNQFSGGIPPLDQNSLVSLNLSHNNLEGQIPSGLSRFSADAFEGNPGLCGGVSGRPCTPSVTPSKALAKQDSSNNGWKIALWCVVAIATLLLLMVAGKIMLRRKHKIVDEPMKEVLDLPLKTGSSEKKKDLDSSGKKGAGLSRFGSSRRESGRGKDLVIVNDEKGEFGLADLMKAAAEVLGNGALGSSYKAMMGSGLTVVVKRIKEMAKMGRDKFDAEMRKLGSLQHKNVQTLLAYHYRKDEKLLVYEYQHKGSLLFALHGDRRICHTELNWPVRLKIVQGIARGLGYLHTELSSLYSPHGDLKSSNVLLTPDYEPLLADYGFCPLISSSQSAQALMAYKSPEAALNQDISPKCDVFCLGIIILEILTGKFPSVYLSSSQGGTDLVQWVRSAMAKGKEADLIDLDIAQTPSCSLGEMVKLLHIGASCTESVPDQRLDLREAVRRIEGVAVEGSDQGMGTLSVLPSLRDGFADQSLSVKPIPSLTEAQLSFRGRP